MTHDQQGSAAPHEPQGTPSTDPTTPSTISLDKDAAPQPVESAPATPDASPATPGTTDTAPYAAGGYGQPGHDQPGYGQPAPAGSGTDGMSIAALVTGILGLGVVPIVLGILGLKRTKANRTSGRGLAIAGIVLGALSFIAWIVIAISLTLASSAIVDSVNEANAAMEELETTAPDAVESDPAETTGTDELATTETPLKDIAPLTVGAFTTPGLTDEPTIAGAGALEAYTAAYSDGTSTVDTVLVNWASAEEATTFATAQTAAFDPASLVDSATFEGVAGQYWVYDVDGVTSALIATNETATLTFTGPAEAVYALYNEFPL